MYEVSCMLCPSKKEQANKKKFLKLFLCGLNFVVFPHTTKFEG